MINIAILANALKDVNMIEIFYETFIPFVILGLTISSSWGGLKFCFNMLKNG
ncbi:hypothetical protein [uncultured Eubacterium sp.]|uniref:hypothetical protein n=1 Tax=uncultured Eubacterium sp. TaxID=165185 RepID=UPI002803DAD6|nr:hypothetical protein [uncultured Eubacterium sp.]